MAFNLVPPLRPDPSKPFVKENGALTDEWVAYFRALDAWLLKLAQAVP